MRTPSASLPRSTAALLVLERQDPIVANGRDGGLGGARIPSRIEGQPRDPTSWTVVLVYSIAS